MQQPCVPTCTLHTGRPPSLPPQRLPFIPCLAIFLQVPEDAQAAVDAVRSALGLARFESVRVKHCAHAYALLLEAPPKPGSEGGGEATAGWKLVFSADTRPCDALVEAAKGATIFIHEVGRGG